jgi:hypothetical protein
MRCQNIFYKRMRTDYLVELDSVLEELSIEERFVTVSIIEN